MVYVDSSAFIALNFPRDENHGTALETFRTLEGAGARLVTSDLVVSEVVTLLGRWIDKQFAADVGNTLYGSRRMAILRRSVEHDLESLDTLAAFPDPKVGFVDCVSFTLMKRQGIETASSFDAHFASAGFRVIP